MNQFKLLAELFQHLIVVIARSSQVYTNYLLNVILISNSKYINKINNNKLILIN